MVLEVVRLVSWTLRGREHPPRQCLGLWMKRCRPSSRLIHLHFDPIPPTFFAEHVSLTPVALFLFFQADRRLSYIPCIE